MPNGKCYRPYRFPGRYCCTVCRDLKDAEEFYKDSSRYNGCSSRCKDCEGKRNNYRWVRTELKERIEEIQSEKAKQGKVARYKYLRDKFGIPYQVEITRFEDGKWVSTELKRV